MQVQQALPDIIVIGEDATCSRVKLAPPASLCTCKQGSESHKYMPMAMQIRCDLTFVFVQQAFRSWMCCQISYHCPDVHMVI